MSERNRLSIAPMIRAALIAAGRGIDDVRDAELRRLRIAAARRAEPAAPAPGGAGVSRERLLEMVGEEFGPAAEGFLSETPPHDPRPRRPTPDAPAKPSQGAQPTRRNFTTHPLSIPVVARPLFESLHLFDSITSGHSGGDPQAVFEECLVRLETLASQVPGQGGEVALREARDTVLRTARVGCRRVSLTGTKAVAEDMADLPAADLVALLQAVTDHLAHSAPRSPADGAVRLVAEEMRESAELNAMNGRHAMAEELRGWVGRISPTLSPPSPADGAPEVEG